MEVLDLQVFSIINQLDLPSWLDWSLIQWREAKTWIPLYIFLIGYLGWKYKSKGLFIILFAIGCAGFSDFTNSRLLKEAVERPRPCHTLTDSAEIDLKVRCGRGYSFPSSHASNHMALAIFLTLSLGFRERILNVILILWAFLVGFSQIYVGVHYPLDILGGFLWGAILALSFYRLLKLIPDKGKTKA